MEKRQRRVLFSLLVLPYAFALIRVPVTRRSRTAGAQRPVSEEAEYHRIPHFLTYAL
jgi:hypothetical protein